MKIAVIVTARASWAKLETLCEALTSRGIDLQIICCASALLERYGRVRDVIAEKFPIAEDVYATVEGETLETSGIETGILLSALTRSLKRLAPDAVVVMADRHEVLAAA